MENFHAEQNSAVGNLADISVCSRERQLLEQKETPRLNESEETLGRPQLWVCRANRAGLLGATWSSVPRPPARAQQLLPCSTCRMETREIRQRFVILRGTPPNIGKKSHLLLSSIKMESLKLSFFFGS